MDVNNIHIKAESFHFNLILYTAVHRVIFKSTVLEFRASTKKSPNTVPRCSLALLSDVLHHQLNLFNHNMSHSITAPENNRFPVRMSNYIDVFFLFERASQFDRLAWLCE